jgi:hypothetical protein
MAFKYDYPDTDNFLRSTTGSDAVPTRGTIMGTPTGTVPDFNFRKFQKARLVLRTVDGVPADVAGTATFTIWYRDLVEITDDGSLVESPPDADLIMWTKSNDWDGVTVDTLEEVVLEDVARRGVYVQVTAKTVGTAVQIFMAPFDRYEPWHSVD